MSLPDRDEVLVRGSWILTSGPEGELRDGAVHIAGGAIAAIGSYADLHREHPDLPVAGDGTGIVVPERYGGSDLGIGECRRVGGVRFCTQPAGLRGKAWRWL